MHCIRGDSAKLGVSSRTLESCPDWVVIVSAKRHPVRLEGSENCTTDSAQCSPHSAWLERPPEWACGEQAACRRTT